MSFFDIFRVSRLKEERVAAIEELQILKQRLADAHVMSDVQLRERANKLSADIAKHTADVESAKQELQRIQAEARQRQNDIVQLDDTILLQEFGLYQPKHKLTNSAAYKVRIDVIREMQAKLGCILINQ